MSLINIIALIVASINTALGIFIYFNNRKDLKNIFLSLFVVFLALWSSSLVGLSYFENIVWGRGAFLFTSLCYIFYFLFISELLKKTIKINKILKNVFLISSILVVLISPTKLIGIDVLKNAESAAYGGVDILLGKAYPFVVLYYVLGLLYLVIIMTRGLRNSSGITKLQMKYLFAGLTVFSSAALITNLLLPYFGFFHLNGFGPIFSVIFIGSMTYAITRYRLMDIKFVLRESFVNFATFLTVLLPYFWIKYYLSFVDFFTKSENIAADLILLAFILYLFPKIQKGYYRLANKYFFSSLYESDEVIAEISDNLSTLDIQKIYLNIWKSLIKAFHLTSFSVLRYKTKKDYYIVKYGKNFKIKNGGKFRLSNFLQENFIEKNKIISIEELKRSKMKKGMTKEIDFFEENDIRILAPMLIEGNVVGLLILGSKETKEIYNIEDLKVLNIVSSQSAIAVENALLYEEKLNFNIKLKKEVKDATKEILLANKKLMKLDEAKSDFISIASHQLRTPLTVIKGYMSMVLDNNFGKLSKRQIDPLTKVSLSSDRLIQLVENLLNISRIESGRLQYRFEDIKLSDIVNSVVEELIGKADEKNLKLSYNKIDKKLPILKLDNEKIRQVVMNLIDNAIKYTEKGIVDVSLEVKKNKIEFCVSDSGMGIEEDDMPNLFKKFSRGKGTATVHTEGTGLGLYVAKQMVDAHKGKIWAESKGKGKGTKFCFELPVPKVKNNK